MTKQRNNFQTTLSANALHRSSNAAENKPAVLGLIFSRRIGQHGWRSGVRALVSSLLCLSVLFVSTPCAAETYKYQDDQGGWHYTDRPPPGRPQPVEVLSVPAPKPQADRDLNAMLRTKFPPQTPLQEATLATVTIHTPIGTGSGFFLSAAGHLLTSKHVVQLPENQRNKLQGNLGEVQQQLERLRQQLAWREQNLNTFKIELDRRQTALRGLSDGPEKTARQAYYQAQWQRYQLMEKELADDRRHFQQLENAATTQRRELGWKLTVADAARTFTIVLKDGTELKAMLVATSKDYDLALLKLDAYQTPYLLPAQLSEVSQGEPVYAIGSPLGRRDSITSGVLSGIESSYLSTDAKIIPGNSGGPLVLANGRVIGINTLKQVIQVPEGKFEGLGLAIGIDTALREFARDLPRN